MTHARLVSFSMTSDGVIRERRSFGDPLLDDLCRRLAEALDEVERAREEECKSLNRVAVPRDIDLTDDQCERIADAILKASGSGLRHYTVPKTRSDIRAAVRASVGEVMNGYEL